MQKYSDYAFLYGRFIFFAELFYFHNKRVYVNLKKFLA